MVKIWVSQTTLNRGKKEDGLSSFVVLHHPWVLQALTLKVNLFGSKETYMWLAFKYFYKDYRIIQSKSCF